MSVCLSQVPSGARPLVAVARGGLIAATSCGRVVHLLKHSELCSSWRLPAAVLSLQWWPDGSAALAITKGGSSWRLGMEAPPSEGGEGREAKRMRTSGTARRLVRSVGDANRVQIPQLQLGVEALIPCTSDSYCALACCRQTPPCLLPFPAWPQKATALYEPPQALPQPRRQELSC